MPPPARCRPPPSLHHLLRTLLEASHDAVLVIEPSRGDVVHLNEEARRLFECDDWIEGDKDEGQVQGGKGGGERDRRRRSLLRDGGDDKDVPAKKAPPPRPRRRNLASFLSLQSHPQPSTHPDLGTSRQHNGGSERLRPQSTTTETPSSPSSSWWSSVVRGAPPSSTTEQHEETNSAAAGDSGGGSGRRLNPDGGVVRRNATCFKSSDGSAFRASVNLIRVDNGECSDGNDRDGVNGDDNDKGAHESYVCAFVRLDKQRQQHHPSSDQQRDRRIARLESRIVELERSNRLLSCANSAILEAASPSIGGGDSSFSVILDEDGVIESFADATTDAARKMFGYENEELIGRNVQLLLGQQEEEEEAEAEARKREGYMMQFAGKPRKEVVARRKDGSTFPATFGVAEIQGAASSSSSGGEGGGKDEGRAGRGGGRGTEPKKRRRKLFAAVFSDVATKQMQDTVPQPSSKEEPSAAEEERRRTRICRSVVDFSFDAAFCVNESGTILAANKAAEALFTCVSGDSDGERGEKGKISSGGASAATALVGKHLDDFVREESGIGGGNDGGGGGGGGRERSGSGGYLSGGGGFAGKTTAKGRKSLDRTGLESYRRYNDLLSRPREEEKERPGFFRKFVRSSSGGDGDEEGGAAGRRRRASSSDDATSASAASSSYYASRELVGRRTDGSEFPASIHLAPVPSSSSFSLDVDAAVKGSAEDDRGRKRDEKQQRQDEQGLYCILVRDLSRLKSAEDELLQKSAAASGIIEAAFDAMFYIDDAGIIEMVNDAAVSQFGWSREEFLGRNISMICGGMHGLNHDGYIKRYMRTGERRVMGKRRELVARRKDGKEFYVELGVREVVTAEGGGGGGPRQTSPGGGGGKPPRRRHFCGFVRDLTNQKYSKSELRRKQNLTAGIIEAAFDALFFINEQGTILLVNSAAVEQFGWSRGEFAGRNISMICGGGRAPHHDSYIKRYLKTGERRVMGKKRELHAKRKDGTEFPIELGLTEVRTEDGEERQFCGFIRDLTRQKAAEAELRRKQHVADGIVAASFDSMFLIDEKGTIMTVNDTAVRQFGWSREEFLGENIKMICGGGRSVHHDGYIARYLRTGERRVMGKKRELEARRKDGTEFPIELGLTEIRTKDGEDDDQSHPRLFCGFIKDLTEHKNAERELRRKQRRQLAMIEASFDAMFYINESGIIETVNEAAVKLFGWSREEFTGRNISMICGGEHGKKHDEYIRRYLRTGERRAMGKRRRLPARRKDGSEFVIELGLSEVKTEEGDQRQFCGYIKDLSDQEEWRSELQRKESITTGIVEAAFDALFFIDETGTIETVNSAAVRQFGWSREEFIGQNIRMICGGEHGPKHDEYLRRYLETGETRIMGTKREVHARRKDGSEFPIELGLAEVKVPLPPSAQGGDSKNSNGPNSARRRRRHFCGFVKDLTQRKAYEAKIEQKQSLATGIVEASLDAMLAINERGIVEMANEAAVELFRRPRMELVGRSVLEAVIPPEEVDAHILFLQQFMTADLTTSPLNKRREGTFRRKDGSTFPALLSADEVEHDGTSRLFALFFHDLTDARKITAMKIDKAKAETLLLNMLPQDIALRLKADQGTIADHYPNCAILFADIVGFTAMSADMEPTEVVSILNHLFSIFDDLVDKYDLNKVKTIGDCYMVTSHPDVDTHVDEIKHICSIGLDMIDAVKKYRHSDHHRRRGSGFSGKRYDIDLRVGINMGPVVAGVVGTKRFLYDLWGDAVNLASRMESTGSPGRIHVTREVVEAVGDSFDFESRGVTHIKGKGNMETFFLAKRRENEPDRPVVSLPVKRKVLRRRSQLVESLKALSSSKELIDAKISELEAKLSDD